MPDSVCGTCGILYDPLYSDAPQKFSFHSEDCQREYRPGIVHATSLACRDGLCEVSDVRDEPA